MSCTTVCDILSVARYQRIMHVDIEHAFNRVTSVFVAHIALCATEALLSMASRAPDSVACIDEVRPNPLPSVACMKIMRESTSCWLNLIADTGTKTLAVRTPLRQQRLVIRPIPA